MTSAESVQLTRDLRASGYSANELARELRRADKVHVRHGAYADEPATDDRNHHLQLIAGTIPRLRRPAVVSHSSAAALHELPTRKGDLRRVHVTRDDQVGGRLTRHLHVHLGDLADEDVVEIGELRATSLARTTADLARTLPYGQAVAVADAALRSGMANEQLFNQLEAMGGRHGIDQLARVARVADGRAESPGESLSRITLALHRIPTPELQFEIRDPLSGSLVARTDFAWPALRTIGEFDGMIKYGRLLKPGQSISDVIFEEKVREDRIRDLGWQVVRWRWPDLDDPAELLARLDRAFARGRLG